MDAERRLRRTRRGAALTLVFASVLATGAATGSWGDETPSEQSQRAVRIPSYPVADSLVANSRAADEPHGEGGTPAAKVPGYDLPSHEVSRSGDRWSSVYSRREYEGFRRGLDGQYVGVGLWARRMPDGTIAVDRVQPGSPAARAGVRTGDRLRSIDGVPVTGRPVTEVVARLRGDMTDEPTGAAGGTREAADGTGQRPGAVDGTSGADGPGAAARGSAAGGDSTREAGPVREGSPAGEADRAPENGAEERSTGPDGSASREDSGARRTADEASGSQVVLGLERAGRQWTETLRRSRLAARNVTVDRLTSGEPDATRIKIESFTKDTGNQVRRAVRAAPDDDGVILDLRGNSGGLVTEAVTAASAFLDGGLVATYDVRGDQQVLNAEPGGDTQTPLVVLVDGGTMSAGELLTGALQDRGRAVVVGSQTFGKGTVQLPTERPDGSVAEETVGQYHTPVGRGVEGVGIAPDLTVGSDAEQRAQSVLSGLGGGA